MGQIKQFIEQKKKFWEILNQRGVEISTEKLIHLGKRIRYEIEIENKNSISIQVYSLFNFNDLMGESLQFIVYDYFRFQILSEVVGFGIYEFAYCMVTWTFSSMMRVESP